MKTIFTSSYLFFCLLLACDVTFDKPYLKKDSIDNLQLPEYEKFILQNKIVEYGLPRDTLIDMYGEPDREINKPGDTTRDIPIMAHDIFVYQDLMALHLKKDKVCWFGYRDDDFAANQKELLIKFRELYENYILEKLQVKFNELPVVLKTKTKTEITSLLNYYRIRYPTFYQFFFKSGIVNVYFDKDKITVKNIRIKNYYDIEDIEEDEK
ncbi:MAG: hypothetical protein AB1349_05875 [Elusimicrobiota bacterium]